jgi:hypothetical protein
MVMDMMHVTADEHDPVRIAETPVGWQSTGLRRRAMSGSRGRFA